MLYTTSAIIRFHGILEDEARKFYESLTDDVKCIEARDTFITFVNENRKHKERIKRIYQEVITDALEAAFPQNYLDEKDYEMDVDVTD